MPILQILQLIMHTFYDTVTVKDGGKKASQQVSEMTQPAVFVALNTVSMCNVSLIILVRAFSPLFYQSYNPDHFPRPPSLPPKPQRMRKSRPRSVFNRKLFNGNMEAFIQVRACLCSLFLSASSAVSLLGRFLAFAPNCWLPLAPGCGSAQCCNAKKKKKKTGRGEKKAIKRLLEVSLVS